MLLITVSFFFAVNSQQIIVKRAKYCGFRSIIYISFLLFITFNLIKMLIFTLSFPLLRFVSFLFFALFHNFVFIDLDILKVLKVPVCIMETYLLFFCFAFTMASLIEYGECVRMSFVFSWKLSRIDDQVQDGRFLRDISFVR